MTAILSALRRELRRQTTGPLRLRRQVFSPTREFRRIERRCRRALADPAFQLSTWESHQPVLLALHDHCREARVLELGVGYSSTPIVLARSSSSVSLESGPDWVERFVPFSSGRHLIRLWSDYTETEWRCPYFAEPWDIAFVDNSPPSTRQGNLLQLAETTRFIVCHDTEECFKPSGSSYGWDFSGFRHVWTYTRFENYTTVVSNVEPIPLTWLEGVEGRPPGSP